jgi:hypothetical protein
MARPNRFAWSNQTQEEQLEMVHRASREDLRLMARAYDWSHSPETVLGWIMSNKSIDLASALTVFFNGDPARFNYLSKREVPKDYRPVAKLLDNICLRVNSGFYRTAPGMKVDNRKRMDRWLTFQDADRREGRRGRWILDETIVLHAVIPSRSHQDMPRIEDLRPADPSAVSGLPVPTALSRRVADLFSGIVQNRRLG